MQKILESRLMWRILAAVELVLFVLFMVVLIRLALSNLFILGCLLTGVIVVLYGAWLMFTGTGGRFRHGVVWSGLGVIGTTMASILFLNQEGNFRLLLVAAGLAAAYAGLFAVLRNLYWRQLRHKNEALRKHFTSPWLIVNPKAGGGRAAKAGLAAAAKEQGIKVIVLKRGDDMQKLARDAIAKGADVLGISGGDGSIGAVAKVAIEHDLPLVVLPGGTRCHFARDLGLDPRYLVDALDGFRGVERRIDVGDINGRIFLNNVSLGAYADIVDHKEYRDNKVAVTRRVLQSILSGKTPAYDIRFATPKSRVKEAVQVLIGVNRYTTMKLLELGHRESMDGGVLQVNAVLRLSDRLLARLLRSASLDRLHGKKEVDNFVQFEAPKLRIKSGQKTMVVGVDGERETYKTPVVVSVRKGALRLCVPAEGLRPRPKSMFSREILARLFDIVKNGA